MTSISASARIPATSSRCTASRAAVMAPSSVIARPSCAPCSRTVDYVPYCNLERPRARNVVARSTAASTQAKATPAVKIDNISDAFATVLKVSYGDTLTDASQLSETITALKNLNLNIRRAKISPKNESSFFITDADTSEKIVRSARLEEIRMTVLNSLVATFPETAGSLNSVKSIEADLAKPLGQRRQVVQTQIDVKEAPNGASSVLTINTPDRPGLLVDIVRVLKDINLNVVSAEVDTVGKQAHDEFFITYHGEPLAPPMVLLVTNALQYYLALNEVATNESY